MNQPINITSEQVKQAAQSGIKMLDHDSVVIPGPLRQQIAVLEVLLQQIGSGAAVVVSTQRPDVESPDAKTQDNDDAGLSESTEEGRGQEER